MIGQRSVALGLAALVVGACTGGSPSPSPSVSSSSPSTREVPVPVSVDVGVSYGGVLDPMDPALEVGSNGELGEGQYGVVLQFDPLRVLEECLVDVVLDLHVERRRGAPPGVYPADVTDAGTMAEGDPRFGIVLDTYPKGRYLDEDVETGWESWQVTDLYRTWAYDGLTEHGAPLPSTHLVLAVRSESATYEFFRRYGSLEGGPDTAPALRVRQLASCA